jgi:hypothetical protein
MANIIMISPNARRVPKVRGLKLVQPFDVTEETKRETKLEKEESKEKLQ